MLLFLEGLFSTFDALSWVDIIFFLAVIFLIILVVTLIYFIIINKDEDTEKTSKIEVKEEVKEEPKIKIYDDPNEKDELIDLRTLTKQMETQDSSPITMNLYEEEQEEKAIISYDELLAKKEDLKLNYEDEKQIGNVTVKKVDMDNITVPNDEKKISVISYEKEEAFLEALKKLQEQIN